MIRALITGASGFIGQIVAREAARRGIEVHGCGRSASAPSCHEGVWHGIAWSCEVMASLLKEVRPDIILHAAGSASVADSLKAPHVDFKASLGTWSTLLEAVRISEQKPVVLFPSSAAVYGNPQSLPVTEDSVCKPVSPYGWHKLMCENLAQSYANAFGARIVIARLFSVIGPHQRRLLAHELFERLQRDPGPLTLMGSGQESRDFLGEREVAGSLLDLALLDFQQTEPLVVNVASGEEVTTLRIAQTIADLCAPGRQVVCRGQPRLGDPLRWCADVSRLRALLPALPKRTIVEAVCEAIAGW